MENCKKCGKLKYNCEILYADEEKIPICPECNEIIISKVKRYTMDHKGATKIDIKKGTGIPLKILDAYIEKGIFELIPSTNICNSNDCSEIVEPGQQFCKRCLKKQKLINELKDLYPESSTLSFDNKSTGTGFHSSLGRRR